MIFQGDRKPSVVQLAVELNRNLDLHVVKGQKLPKNAFSGFHGRSSEVFFSLTPGSSMCVASMPRTRVFNQAIEIYGEPAMDQLLNQNICSVKPKDFDRMAKKFAQDTNNQTALKTNTTNVDDTILCFLDALDQSKSEQSQNDIMKNVDLVREFVRLCHDECCNRPLTISDFTQQLFTSKTVLSVAIRQATGLSPLMFLRNIRLEQVRNELLNHDQDISIINVARRYGFHSRGHFSRYYKEFFGELPRETLLKR